MLYQRLSRLVQVVLLALEQDITVQIGRDKQGIFQD